MAERYLVVPLLTMSVELDGAAAADWLQSAREQIELVPEEFRATYDGKVWHLALDPTLPMRVEIEGEEGSQGVVRELLRFDTPSEFEELARPLQVDEDTEALRQAIRNYYNRVLEPGYNSTGTSPYGLSGQLLDDLRSLGMAVQADVLIEGKHEEGDDEG